MTELVRLQRAQRNTEGEVGGDRGRNERRDILISAKAAWCILGGQKLHRKPRPGKPIAYPQGQFAGNATAYIHISAQHLAVRDAPSNRARESLALPFIRARVRALLAASRVREHALETKITL